MICPRCNQDQVIKAVIKATGEIVHICPECDALWPYGSEIRASNFTDFSIYVKPKGLNGLWSELQACSE